MIKLESKHDFLLLTATSLKRKLYQHATLLQILTQHSNKTCKCAKAIYVGKKSSASIGTLTDVMGLQLEPALKYHDRQT